ncbi:MAG TPA: heat-inducible transcriptional repressor HrcA [Acidimicrobiia bacterium]|nr:heat-inducible transcriptional repressor HrcA [Acidimicrobiia bacterium]
MDDRKAAILQAVVEAYIATAQPVGSGAVLRESAIDVSAATVRNEMAALEREGYLTQPHTSAGRVPTEAGYRFFVDQIQVGQSRLSAVEARRVRSFFEHARGEIEQHLDSTSKLLSDLTDYAAVVVGPRHDPALVRSIDLVALSPSDALVVVVLSDGAVVKHHLDVGRPFDDDVVRRAAMTLRESFVGGTLSSPGEPRPTGDVAIDDLAAQASAALNEPSPGPSYVGGTSRMASQFDAISTVREVLAILEEQLMVVSLLSDLVDRGLSVAIGSETGLEPLMDCSVVVAPYTVEGEEAGTIGLLGPTRMDYPKALATVATVSRRLGRSLETNT